jgi:hypothetical protein
MEDKPSKEDELEEFIKAGRTGRRYESIFIYVNNNKSFFVIMCDILWEKKWIMTTSTDVQLFRNAVAEIDPVTGEPVTKVRQE